MSYIDPSLLSMPSGEHPVRNTDTNMSGVSNNIPENVHLSSRRSSISDETLAPATVVDMGTFGFVNEFEDAPVHPQCVFYHQVEQQQSHVSVTAAQTTSGAPEQTPKPDAVRTYTSGDKCDKCFRPVDSSQYDFCREIGKDETLCDKCLDEEAQEALEVSERWKNLLAERKAARLRARALAAVPPPSRGG
ncbi:hypothetical protein B0T16DRAFT_463550 [Cercophora newfieldiana]|uniref:Uncharacterized protein n=1 Tax=Cercophora newfieldiana TaxID=92897 RepID=A0AA39XUK5_9PEZI|nr:hypothetical protein B0T16DRAFT_463550 [Cercophora newfieldiana]